MQRHWRKLTLFIATGALFSIAAGSAQTSNGSFSFQFPDLSQITPQQIFALSVLGLVLSVAVISLGIALWLYFTERELRAAFPEEYSKRKDKVGQDEPFLPEPQYWLPRVALGSVIGLLLAGIAVAVTTQTPRLFPIAASFEALQIDALFDGMMIVMVIIFLVVEGALVYAAIRFRAKKDDLTDAEPIHGNVTLEVTWTVVPAIIMVWLAVYTVNVLTDIQDDRPTELTVIVTGQQFSWQYEYPDMGGYKDFNKLTLPAGVTTRLVFRSEDVIHSFWVPAFRMKRDVMPNIDTEMFVTPIEPGEYEVRCAELCGLKHSNMLSMVVVEDIAGWARFVEEHGTPEVVDTSDPIAYGRSLFQKYGCVGCHTLTDANSSAVVGPELNGIGSRGADYIRESILDPSAVIAEDFTDVMPKTFSEAIPPEEIDALVEYLLLQE